VTTGSDDGARRRVPAPDPVRQSAQRVLRSSTPLEDFVSPEDLNSSRGVEDLRRPQEDGPQSTGLVVKEPGEVSGRFTNDAACRERSIA
jgi:hypothetical protein